MDVTSIKPGSTQSLREYLQRENPVINNLPCKTGKNTTTNNNNFTLPRYIELWEDFELDSLKAMYGGALQAILEQNFYLHDHSAIPQFPFCEVHDEDSLNSLLIRWTHSIVSDALATAQKQLEGYNHGVHIFMVRGGQANYAGSSSKYRADWAAVQQSPSYHSTKNPNILPGDTKLSSKWSSEHVGLGPVSKNVPVPQWLNPLTQVYTYCIRANVRYGYIITDEELVVLRVRPGPQDKIDSVVEPIGAEEPSLQNAAQKAERSGTVEFKAIPWADGAINTDGASEKLTVNLALWWLHLMAADASEIKDHYSPLRDATWTNDINDPFASFSSDTSILAKKFAEAMPAHSRRLEREASSDQRKSRKRSRDDHAKTSNSRNKRSRGGKGKRRGGSH